MKRPAIWLAGLLVLLIFAMAGKSALVTPPGVPATVPRGEFDTHRALARLQRILGDQRPHPVDSAANDSVRARLLAELRAIGLAPRVTDDWACNGSPTSRLVSCARVRNVVATIGPTTERHVLVASHYDSTPAGPGAADDGIGVAVALEIAALLKDRPLPRPVTFLFDEGEEAGLLGAKAFLEHDPLAARVDSVVNLEARGVTGPAIMFETSRPNGAAVAAYARAGMRPVANSLTADIYRLIPNSTDVTVFAARPWTMLNFAIIGNETRYHSPGDTLAALDPRSVRHMGVEALAAARALAAAEPGGRGERVYTDLLGRGMVSLPMWAGLALLAALLLGFGWTAWRRRGGIGRAAATVAAALAASAASAFLAQTLLGLLRPGEFSRAHPEVIAAAIDLTALAAALAVLIRLGRPLTRDRLRPAFWLVFLLLGAVLAAFAPGTSIFFLAPPLAALAGIAIEPRLPGAERIAALTAWALLFLSWGPLLNLGEVLLGFAGGWIFALVAALLVLPVLIECKPLLNRVPRAWSAGAVALAALAGWTAVALAPAYSPDRKQQFRIEYGWDSNSGRGMWGVVNDGAALPPAFAAFRPNREVPWSPSKRWAADAPPVPLPPPSLKIVPEAPTPYRRRQLLTAGADSVLLLAPPQAALREVRVTGSGASFGRGKPKDPFTLRCIGRSCDGLVFDLRADAPPAEAKLVGVRRGVPADAAPLLRARPRTAGPQYAPDQSFAVAKVRL
jgi:hypothetical protein